MSGSRRKPLSSKVRTLLESLFSPSSDILLDVNGKLEGESIVGKAIQKTPNLWCFEEPPLSNASSSSLSNRSSPSPTMSESPTASPTGIADRRLGGNRFSGCCGPRTSTSKFAFRISRLLMPASATYLPLSLPQSHLLCPTAVMTACCHPKFPNSNRTKFQ